MYTYHLSYVGHATVDSILSTPMIPWVIAQIRRAGNTKQVAVRIGNGSLDIRKEDDNVSLSTHPLHQVSRLTVQTTSIFYCVKDQNQPLIVCHLFESSDPHIRASKGKIPWKYLCGGSLLDHRTVLTACHCVLEPLDIHYLKPNKLYVIAGSDNIWKKSTPTRETAFVQDTIAHPSCSYLQDSKLNGTMEYDVAVLFTSTVLRYNSGVGGLTLFGALVSPEMFKLDKCVIVGHGTESDGRSVKVMDQLEMEEVLLLTRGKCRDYFCKHGYEGLCKYYLEGKGQSCARIVQSGSWALDPGGPLVCNGSVFGVMSGGLKNTPLLMYAGPSIIISLLENKQLFFEEGNINRRIDGKNETITDKPVAVKTSVDPAKPHMRNLPRNKYNSAIQDFSLGGFVNVETRHPDFTPQLLRTGLCRIECFFPVLDPVQPASCSPFTRKSAPNKTLPPELFFNLV
ncbi:hypothetical protein GE061_013996 [Apolygus lucorum]|uniref:Peptidase S1 domain-containing protein n=1 Tax=Apolygus lucorum TaxID=248454 RepID=A0A8S9XTF5_APOLU|nr:hypothetical protein GE061_013996 [Apolygus lucorum]